MAKVSKTLNQKRTTATRSNLRSANASRARNNREKKMLGLIAILVIALVGTIGVAIAAFSTELHIHGTATVKASTWDIHFQNLKAVKTNGKAEEITAPTIQAHSKTGVAATAIRDYEVTLKDPGDYIEYTFEVINAGDLDAVLDEIIIKTGANLSCTAVTSDNSIATKVCAKLNYTLTYDSGATVQAGDTLPAEANTTPGGNVKTMKLKLEFDASAESSDLPNVDVSVSGLDIQLTYAQDESND